MKIAIVLLLLTLASCMHRSDRHPQRGYGAEGGANFTSNGERIYFTGTSSSGSAISSSAGEQSAGRHMRGRGCAGCHGADRSGRQLWPRFWIGAPSLTPAALTDDRESPYDADALRLVISTGVAPAGKILDSEMPRWTMSASDLDDLVDYLLNPG